MDIIIIYFSGTGNTQLVSDQLSIKLSNKGHNVELLSIENISDISQINFNNKIVGFGFPIYKLTYPDIFINFIESLNTTLNENPVFLFSTYARFEANALLDFGINLKNCKIIGLENFKSPSCGISARKNENDYEYKTVMFFENDIDKKLNKFVDQINQCKPIKIKYKTSSLYKIKQLIVKNIEITKYPNLRINYSKCTKCGLCLKKCPDDNFALTENKKIIVKDEKSCLHCLRCMNHCPGNSITFGKLTEGENQYTLTKRNNLFKKAAGGYKEDCWENFNKINKKWRKNTIRYWIMNWYRPEI